MNYCDNCGAANDILQIHCHRCGVALTSVDQPFGPVAVAAAPTTPSEAADDGAADELGLHLELPDWLKHAAAETPADSPAAAASAGSEPNLPPPGFYIPSQQPHDADAAADLERAPLAHSLPPVPAPGLSGSIPDWLKAQPAPQAHAEPVAAPLTDVADPNSFISETDLPEWIRQIAAADAAKQAELERQAEATKHVEPVAPVRTAVPGDPRSSAPATNPWLARRETAAAAQAWATSAASKPAAPSTNAAATEPSVYESPAADTAPAKKERSLPKPTLPRFGASAEGGNPRLRLALFAAAVLLLVILLLGTVV